MACGNRGPAEEPLNCLRISSWAPSRLSCGLQKGRSRSPVFGFSLSRPFRLCRSAKFHASCGAWRSSRSFQRLAHISGRLTFASRSFFGMPSFTSCKCSAYIRLGHAPAVLSVDLAAGFLFFLCSFFLTSLFVGLRINLLC